MRVATKLHMCVKGRCKDKGRDKYPNLINSSQVAGDAKYLYSLPGGPQRDFTLSKIIFLITVRRRKINDGGSRYATQCPQTIL